MALIYLIIFIIAEIALTVLTFTKIRMKSCHRKYRMIFSAAEAAVRSRNLQSACSTATT